MNLSPLGRDGREAPVRVLQLGIDMSKTACIQTATQCPLLSFDSLLRSTPLPSLPRCARASLEARPRSLCELRYGPKGERGGTRIGQHCLQRPAQIVSPRVFCLPPFAAVGLCGFGSPAAALLQAALQSKERERWDAAGRDFDGVDRSLRYDRHGKGRGFSCACGARL